MPSFHLDSNLEQLRFPKVETQFNYTRLLPTCFVWEITWGAELVSEVTVCGKVIAGFDIITIGLLILPLGWTRRWLIEESFGKIKFQLHNKNRWKCGSTKFTFNIAFPPGAFWRTITDGLSLTVALNWFSIF